MDRAFSALCILSAAIAFRSIAIKQNKASGPIWLKGGVPVESSDGTSYKVRNRQTLCRCGKSQNKPFCDGSHIDEGFSDGDDSLK